MIKVEGLTKRYGRVTAVDNISFSVEKGQIVGFLGPNGAGKTTTMRVLTCFLPPTAGSVSVAGFDVLEQPLEVKKRVGYLPESPPLYPEMRVSAYLTFVARLKGVPKREVARRVNEACEKCAVANVKDRIIGQLSKGYRQRVGLAQAVIHNPDVLILDEPTTGLDPKQIIETRQLIRNLAGEHTVIMSTHILPAVEQTCQQVIVIDNGKVVANDSVQNLTQRERGVEAVSVEVASREGALDHAGVQRRLEQVPGVSRVQLMESGDGLCRLEVEGLAGRLIRDDVARAVLDAGWRLHELRPVSLSLEQMFLELTAATEEAATEAAAK
ncbi:MAG: ATP-binding cassette domain-containing protein [Bryobacteraceae bacterium]|jgi:ABC-2 type transport system ATP-binding protein